jgi:hypothetical protein
MKRALTAVALSFSLLASQTAMAAGDAAALAPGKPAGVRQAAMHAPIWVWVVGIGLIGLGIGLAASSGGGNSSGSTNSTHL